MKHTTGLAAYSMRYSVCDIEYAACFLLILINHLLVPLVLPTFFEINKKYLAAKNSEKILRNNKVRYQSYSMTHTA